MLHHLREMLHRIPAPRRYGRVMALLLASLGGAVDVFSHIHYEALVATQTGNFILLIADLHRDAPHVVHLRWLSVILFSFGYLAGHFIHDLIGQRARMRHWRIGTLLPFLLVCFAVPFMDRTLSNSFQVGALAFTVGLMIHAPRGYTHWRKPLFALHDQRRTGAKCSVPGTPPVRCTSRGKPPTETQKMRRRHSAVRLCSKPLITLS